MKKDKMVKLIIEAIQRPGEDYTDGECMDEVVRIVEEAGYDFKWDEWHKSQAGTVGRIVLPLSEYRRD